MKRWLTLSMLLGCGDDQIVLNRLCDHTRSEIRFNGLDDDCDKRVDEGAFNTRVHCGEAHVSCFLEPGASDVACVDGECVPVGPGTETYETECLDGLDNDGNGVVDDGPLCEVLIANVARPECHGRTGGPDGRLRGADGQPGERAASGCPATAISMGQGGATEPGSPAERRPDHGPRHLVYLTRDTLVDRYEVSRGQLQQFLYATGRCGARPAGGCEVTPEALNLPASAVTWCEAYAYCEWAGKRLLTEAEWERMAAGTEGVSGLEFPWSDQAPIAPNDGTEIGAPEPICRTADCGVACKEHGPVVSTCFPSGERYRLLPVDHVGGTRLVGHGTDLTRPSTLILNVCGNVWEWVFDAFDRYPIGPNGEPVDQVDPVNLGISPNQARAGQPYGATAPAARVNRGSSLVNALDSCRTANRNYPPPLAAIDAFGFRCGRSFGGVDPPYPVTPVEEQPACAAISSECTRPVGGDTILSAVDVCSPDLPTTGFGPAVAGALRTELASRSQVTLALDPAGATLGLAVRGEGQLCWSQHSDPINQPGAICTTPDCDIDFGRKNLVLAPILGDPDQKLDFEVEHLREEPAAERTCGRVPGEGERRLVMEGVLTRSPDFELAGKTLPEAACYDLGLTCIDPNVSIDDCRDICPGWRVRFDLIVSASDQ